MLISIHLIILNFLYLYSFFFGLKYDWLCKHMTISAGVFSYPYHWSRGSCGVPFAQPLYGQPVATWTSDPSVDRKRSRKQPSFHITVTEVPELSWYSITLYKNRSIALFANLNCFVSFILYILVCLLNCSLLRYSFYQ